MPLTGRTPYTKELKIEQFWVKVKKTSGCWLWKGVKSKLGYGRYWWEGKMMGAHRVSLILAGRKPRNGDQVDHKCFNPPCVNPSHLEFVTPLENVRRANARKLLCVNGHSLKLQVSLKAGHKTCGECRRERGRERYARERERWKKWQRAYRKSEKYKRWWKQHYVPRGK